MFYNLGAWFLQQGSSFVLYPLFQFTVPFLKYNFHFLSAVDISIVYSGQDFVWSDKLNESLHFQVATMLTVWYTCIN